MHFEMEPFIVSHFLSWYKKRITGMCYVPPLQLVTEVLAMHLAF